MKKIYFSVFTFLFAASLYGQTADPPSGHGTSSDDPYLIATLNNLYWVTQNSSSWGSYFKQTGDIDASSSSGWRDADPGDPSDSHLGFTPIGNSTTNFTGTYDGGAHIISGLWINRSHTAYIGFLGYCWSATVKNIGLINVNITGYAPIGGLAGETESSSQITNCYTTGSVFSVMTAPSFGGLVGCIGYSGVGSPQISNCYSTASVSGYNNVGGLVGSSGIATITNCYSTGRVTSTIDGGGLIGYNYNTTVTDCFWNTETSGQSGSAGGTGKTTAEMKTQSTFDPPWDFAAPIWKMDQNNGGYPYLSWQVFSPPTTQASDITFSSVTYHSMTVNWTNGVGSNRVAFMMQGNSGTASPANYTIYTADASFESGTQIGSTGWYCVYNGTGSSVSITGLSPATDYILQVFEYNYPGSELYLTPSATGNPKAQATIALAAPTTQASAITFSNVEVAQFTIGWTNGNGDARAVFVKQACSGTASPADNTTYTANAAFGSSGTQIGTSGWYCVYNGTGTSVDVTGLNRSTNYVAHVCEYNGPAGSEKYSTSSVADNPKSQTTASTITLLFNSNNSDCISAGATNVPTSGDHTIEAWIKPSSMMNALGNPCGILGWEDAGGNTTNGLRLTSDGIVNYWDEHSYPTVDDGLTVTTGDISGAWHHVAATYDGTRRFIYLDGTLVNSGSAGTYSASGYGGLTIGHSDGNLGDYFDGEISEVRIWDICRLQSDIQSTMHTTLTGHESDLVAYYPLNEGSGKTAHDLAGLNDGTINMPFDGTDGWVGVSDLALPVQATDFLAKADVGSVTLSWQTQSEVNNAGFNVLREDPNTTVGSTSLTTGFKLIASYTSNNGLKGMGTSSTGRTYSFIDNNVTSGKTYQYKIQSVSTNGTTNDLATLTVTVDIPKTYALYQNYPNPFNPSTTIRFDLKQQSTVTLEIYNTLGQRVEYWNYGMMDAGRYNENINMTRFASGVYYYRIMAQGNDGQKFVEVKKLVLLK